MTKIVINEPKSKKSYQIEKAVPSLVGMKIGQKLAYLLLDNETSKVKGVQKCRGTKGVKRQINH